jgi:C-terminal processing protease CtpA/Prc
VWLACAAALLLLSASVRAQPALSEGQRVAALCEVWGLLKYHHPLVAGRSDWDDVFLAAVPSFLAAQTRKDLSGEIVALIREAGLAPIVAPSATVERSGAELGPAFAWIDDETLYAPETSVLLRAVVASHRPQTNRFVARGAVGNPDFSGDQGFFQLAVFPSQQVRLLALARFWNMVQYYFPSRDLMDRSWAAVLPELAPAFLAAGDAREYHLAVAAMTASIQDGHASTWSNTLADTLGSRIAPLQVRLVEGRTVVTRAFTTLLAGVDVRPGDVVTGIDGTPTAARRASLRPYTQGSNEASLERNVHAVLLRTNAARIALTLEGERHEATVDVTTVPLGAYYSAEQNAQSGNVSAVLPGNIGYIHMGRLDVAGVDSVMARLRDTRGLVLDIRNYPQGTLHAIANYLNPAPQPFAKFTQPDFERPGSFSWTGTLSAGPGSAGAWTRVSAANYNYKGRVAVLADQETQSQAEFTVMAFETAPDVTVVGSTTAGADGNVSEIRLPGGLTTYISGLGVYYPDGRPTQRIGIVPDRVAVPTVRGLRDGRDEVLEAALEVLR